MAFRLRKWYLDLVTQDGQAAILYWADVRVLGLRFRHASLTLVPANSSVIELRSSRAGREPAVSSSDCRYDHAPLGIRGRWSFRQTSINTRLLEHPDGVVDWTCLSPLTDVELRVHADTLIGSGYVERLDMTFPAWRLPIRTLHWGRAITPSHAAVWIRWLGPEPRNLFWLDCVPQPLVPVNEQSVVASTTRVEMQTVRLIRDAKLGSTMLRALPILPAPARRSLGIHERKLVAAATIHTPAGSEPGWAIHEEVTWPGD